MNKLKVILFLILILAVGLAPQAAPAQANAEPYTRIDGSARGYPYTLLKPADWNGDLVLLVHGSVPWWFEILAPELAAMGFGVGWSTMGEENGLEEGDPLREITLNTRVVQAQFTDNFELPNRTYLYGFSRGFHNVTKLLETSPSRYDGALIACGGSSMAWDYFFNARLLFDHYFPGILPGSLLDPPAVDMATFYFEIAPLVIQAVEENPELAEEMAAISPYLPPYNGRGELGISIVESLAAHSTEGKKIIADSGGIPFDNTQTVYTGSSDDAVLNAAVPRVRADPPAINYLRNWAQPTGAIGATPVLILHTSRDPNTPERFNDIYQAQIENTGNGDYYHRRVMDRFGHCAFSMNEFLTGFTDLVSWVETGLRP